MRKPKPGPARSKPGPDQAWPKPDFWKFGNLKPGNLGIWNPEKSKNKCKIKIRSAQNVGRVWISRKKNLLAPFGAISGTFSMDRNNAKYVQVLRIFLGGPMGPIQPLWPSALPFELSYSSQAPSQTPTTTKIVGQYCPKYCKMQQQLAW